MKRIAEVKRIAIEVHVRNREKAQALTKSGGPGASGVGF